MPAVPVSTVAKRSDGDGSKRVSKPGIITRTRTFSKEVSSELSKATWPWDNKEKGVKKYRELTDSTVVVVVAMLLMGGFVAFWDLILSSILGLIAR